MKKTISILDEHSGAHVAELFRAFSDTSRVRMISALMDDEQNVSTLAPWLVFRNRLFLIICTA